MSFLRNLFRAASPAEPAGEIVEYKISLDLPNNSAWAKIRGRKEVLVSELLKGSHPVFSRFYLTGEDRAKTHFAPSLKEAIDWFRGRSSPKDGYGSISWGDHAVYQCELCKYKRKFDLVITKVEKVALFVNFPVYREITGWRILEVSNEILGVGMPTKFIRLHETVPVIKWRHDKQKYLCARCAEKLVELGREAELPEYQIFE